MRLRKLLLALILSTALGLETICLGWSAANSFKRSLSIYSLRLVFSLYVSTLAIRSINQNNIGIHKASVLHLTVLTFTASSLLFSIAILPSGVPSVVSASETDTFPELRPLWYTSLALYSLACVVLFTTRLGPRLHYPPELIYSEKTMSATTNLDEENVCGITGRLSFFSTPRLDLQRYP